MVKNTRQHKKRSSKKRTLRKKGNVRGGCSCNTTAMKGGFYQLNTFENDPNNPSTVTSERLLQIGGKRGKNKIQKGRKTRGGGINLPLSFDTTAGSFGLASAFNGTVPTLNRETGLINGENPQLI
jgi:hypothetical protein